jgi:hypothetical protein
MSSKHLLGDTNYAWPTAEIAVMGAKVKTWRHTFLGWGPLLIKSCVAGQESRSGLEGSLLPRQSSHSRHVGDFRAEERTQGERGKSAEFTCRREVRAFVTSRQPLWCPKPPFPAH